MWRGLASVQTPLLRLEKTETGNGIGYYSYFKMNEIIVMGEIFKTFGFMINP